MAAEARGGKSGEGVLSPFRTEEGSPGRRKEGGGTAAAPLGHLLRPPLGLAKQPHPFAAGGQPSQGAGKLGPSSGQRQSLRR